MKARITVITLGVENLKKSLEFYRDGLGLKTEGIVGEEFEYGAVAFFDLENGIKLGIWPRKSLAHDAGLELTPFCQSQMSIAQNVASEDEVNQVMAQAKAAGAKIVKPAEKTFYGGYSGYFQDPDGHLWEIAWNPGWKIDE